MHPAYAAGVVVLMTSIPRRIDHMEPVIDAILAQSWQPADPRLQDVQHAVAWA